jgi:cardiolipin synthase
VQVELLLPAGSNHALADIARERSLRELAAAGARIHLLPRMLHAKALVIDAGLASCGSINFDGRSLFLNYELNVLFHDAVQIEALAHWFAARRAESSTYVARAPGWWRDVGEGLVRSVGFQL